MSYALSHPHCRVLVMDHLGHVPSPGASGGSFVTLKLQHVKTEGGVALSPPYYSVIASCSWGSRVGHTDAQQFT